MMQQPATISRNFTFYQHYTNQVSLAWRNTEREF